MQSSPATSPVCSGCRTDSRRQAPQTVLGIIRASTGVTLLAAVGVMCEGQMLTILRISSSLLNPLLLQGQKNKIHDDKVSNMTAEPWSQAQDRHEISHQDTGMGVWVGKMSLHLYVYLPPRETDSGM